MANPHATGASKAINKSIQEIESALAGTSLSAAGALRKKLRARISKLAKYWFRRGFRRGCIETARIAAAGRKCPKKVTYDAYRDFFDGKQRRVKVSVKVSWKKK